jgi:phosphoribosylanthranilate isomerase
MTKAKICGLFRAEDIEIVNNLAHKPDYIGFVFAPSRRRVTPEQAARLKSALSPEIAAVGVFVNEPPQNIAELVARGIIDMIQLHGGESDDYIHELRRLTESPIIRAVNPLIKPNCQLSIVNCQLLYDSPNPGSGQVFDWGALPVSEEPFFLAGGLTPENVAEAIARIHPFAVDVSSGVEENAVKNAGKIEKFMKIVQKFRKNA